VYNITNVEGSTTSTTATIVNVIECSNDRRDRDLQEQMLTVVVETQSVSRSPLVVPKTVEDITSQIQTDIQSTESPLMIEVVKVTGRAVLNMTVSVVDSPSASPSVPPTLDSSAMHLTFGTYLAILMFSSTIAMVLG
jgi:hypothetical protein